MSNDFPDISISQFVIILCEIETGIVLNKDFERYTGQGERYYVFNSLEEAESFSMKVMEEKPNIESTIYSYDKSAVKTIINENYYKKKALETKSKKKWWPFK
ncbi:MAG TPA: hypothetical protein VF941_12070 [Clostridia bacterium]